MVRTKHVRFPVTINPQGIQGDRNPLGTPFSPIFRRATKDGAVGDRRLPSAAGKNVQRKISPPEVAGLAERQVKKQAQNS